MFAILTGHPGLTQVGICQQFPDIVQGAVVGARFDSQQAAGQRINVDVAEGFRHVVRLEFRPVGDEERMHVHQGVVVTVISGHLVG